MKAAQAVVFAGIFITALPVLLSASTKRHLRAVFSVYFVTALLGLPALTQHYFRLSWFVGDALLLSVPLLIGLAINAAADGDARAPQRYLRVILTSLFVAAVIASFFPDPYDSFRYVAPAPLIMAATWVYFLTERGFRQFLAGLCLGAIAILTWNSQWRSSALVFAMIGLVSIYFVLQSRARALLVLCVASGAVLVLGFGLGLSSGESDLAGSHNRLLATFEEGGLQNDSSTMFRFVEVDAVKTTAETEWSYYNAILGAGHGATYDFAFLSQLPGSVAFEDRNGEDGRVHNIHLGPAMVAYRYGLLGLGFAIFVMTYAGRRFVTEGRKGNREPFIVALGFFGCGLLGIANNVTTQIHFTLTAALFIPFVIKGHSVRKVA